MDSSSSADAMVSEPAGSKRERRHGAVRIDAGWLLCFSNEHIAQTRRAGPIEELMQVGLRISASSSSTRLPDRANATAVL